MSLNREALKQVSSLNIDTQMCYQIGMQVFNPAAGIKPDEFSNLVVQANDLYSDILRQVTFLKGQLPAIKD